MNDSEDTTQIPFKFELDRVFDAYRALLAEVHRIDGLEIASEEEHQTRTAAIAAILKFVKRAFPDLRDTEAIRALERFRDEQLTKTLRDVRIAERNANDKNGREDLRGGFPIPLTEEITRSIGLACVGFLEANGETKAAARKFVAEVFTKEGVKTSHDQVKQWEYDWLPRQPTSLDSEDTGLKYAIPANWIAISREVLDRATEADIEPKVAVRRALVSEIHKLRRT